MKMNKKGFLHIRSPRFQSLVLGGLFVFLVAGFGGVLLFNNIQLYRKTKELRARAEELRLQKVNLETQKAKLQTDITQSQTLQYQEKALREKGLYQKLGEQVITVVPQEKPQEAPKKPQRAWWDPRGWIGQ
jgi:cell division protein FtsB